MKKGRYKGSKKVKKTAQPKKHESHLNLLTQARKEMKGLPRTIKRKKYLLCWVWKKKSNVFWILGRRVKI